MSSCAKTAWVAFQWFVPLAAALGADWASMSPPQILSEELPGGAVPGEAGTKVRLVRLAKTQDGAKDGRLVITYADANHTQPVWDPQTLTHLPRDVFVRYSDDDGKTWSSPVNISNSAGAYSALSDFDGDGVDTPYWGDCDKATIAASGDVIVVSWVGKYSPEPHWAWGQSGVSALQGASSYDDPLLANPREVPFSGVYVALSTDGGTSWIRGDVTKQLPPLQITYASRDAINDVHRGSGHKWVLTWQEDPSGLQPGEAEGPGEGASGSIGTPGTDVWYTWVSDIVADPTGLATNRTPLTNQSRYNMTYPEPVIVGSPGDEEFHAATRPNISLAKEGSTHLAIVAYEESKSTSKGSPPSIGKTVQYHAFPYDTPVVNGACECLIHGDGGTTLSAVDENARRVRFVTQEPNGVDPAVFVFWRQGVENEGGAADVVGRVSKSLEPSAVVTAPALNLSSNTPIATDANLNDATTLNPIDDARAHRAILRGSFVAVGYSYTRDLPLAETTVLENYDFWVRRSFDGGNAWTSAFNLSHLDKSENVLEPRLVSPAASTSPDPTLVVAYSTETNVNDQLGEVPVIGDIEILRSRDLGASWTTAMDLAASPDPERESQIVVGPNGAQIFAVWMKGGATDEAMFAELTNRWFTPGDLLRVRFPNPGAIVDLEFDAVHFEKLKLNFAKGDVVSHIRADVFGPLTDDGSPMLVAKEPIATFEVQAGKLDQKKVVMVPESGRYLLRFTHIDGALGPFAVDTGRKLPPRGLVRKVVIAPDPSTLLGHWSAQLLTGASFDVVLRPSKPFTASLSLALPDGDTFDCSSYAEQYEDVVRYDGMPITITGTHRLTISGFQAPGDRVVLKAKTHQPLPGDAEIEVP